MHEITHIERLLKGQSLQNTTHMNSGSLCSASIYKQVGSFYNMYLGTEWCENALPFDILL